MDDFIGDAIVEKEEDLKPEQAKADEIYPECGGAVRTYQSSDKVCTLAGTEADTLLSYEADGRGNFVQPLYR